MTEQLAGAAATSDADSRRRRLNDHILPALDPRPYIDGAFVDPSASATRDIQDPYTDAVLLTMPECGTADVDRAVTAAREAFDDRRWSGLPTPERAACLRRLADLIDERHDDLALLESADNGKTITDTSNWDISTAAATYRYYADLVEEQPEDRPIPGSTLAYYHREPAGVVAALLPWNFPFPCMSWKIGPALAAGCCVVVKSPERAPASAQALAALVTDAGFPPGVVNVLMGTGPEAGAALVADPRIDVISFTGGTATATTLVRTSAGHLPRMALELGGKGPNLVWADADLDAAVAGTEAGMFALAGQNCSAASRTIVHEDIAEQFIELLVERGRQRRLGDPFDDATQQGPQIDARQVQHIHGIVEDARHAGAEVLLGGETPAELGGNFYAPTIIDVDGVDARIVREEVFGPVSCVFRVRDLDAAIALANATEFGLSASVWSTDDAVLDRFVEESRVGTCWVNTYGVFVPEVPWGGTKMSGYGRELGHAGLNEFTTDKVVFRQR